MPRYEYLCNQCNREYIEVKEANQPQFFIDCGRCSNGKLIPKE
jgi:hypothetical protein